MRFLRAFKCFVSSEKFQHAVQDVKDDRIKVSISETYLQIVKLLFEGQSRKTPCLQYMRKVFNPILSKIQVCSLKKKLGKVQDADGLLRFRDLLEDQEQE